MKFKKVLLQMSFGLVLFGISGCANIMLDRLTIPDSPARKGPVYQLFLPNLLVKAVDVSPIGNRLAIRVTIGNNGRRNAAAFNVISDVFLRSAGRSVRLSARWPALGAGQESRRELGVIENVDCSQFADVDVFADLPTGSRPAGEVLESNEQDNIDRNGIFIACPPDGHIEDEGHLPADRPPF